SLINSLSHFPKLKVISRSSVFRYKGRQVDAREVGRELGVRKVLTGRILQRGDTLSISVDLESAQDDQHIWGEQYERRLADLMHVPRELADEIARNMRASWARRPVRDRSYPGNAEAYQEYLKGRYFWNKRTGEDIRQAIEHFQAAIRLDPGYALAHVGVAEAYIVLGVYSSVPVRDAYAEAKAAALKALELDPDLAEAHASLAAIKAGHDWDLPGALQGFARALRLKANYATAHQWYAEHLVCVGREDQAIEEARLALELDPVSLVINTSLGLVLTMARRFDEALAQLQKTVEMDRNFAMAHRLLGDVYLEQNQFELAIEKHRLAAVLAGEAPAAAEARSSALLSAYQQGGPTSYWRKQLELVQRDLESTASSGDAPLLSLYHLAGLHARLGETEAAVQSLEAACDRRDYSVLSLRTNPAFDSLRSHPAVAKLMRRLGLPD
ncbi:MAG: TPR end-of-group domain-containing protein, partial [Terriglobales bacterium]